MEISEYEFQPMNENHEWIVIGPEFKITFKFIEVKSKNVHYTLMSKVDGKDILGSVSEAIKLYIFRLSKVIKPITSNMIRMKNWLQVYGDPMQIITALNTYITTHPIKVASIIISDFSPMKSEVMDDQ